MQAVRLLPTHSIVLVAIARWRPGLAHTLALLPGSLDDLFLYHPPPKPPKPTHPNSSTYLEGRQKVGAREHRGAVVDIVWLDQGADRHLAQHRLFHVEWMVRVKHVGRVAAGAQV